jgi:hypothetical protein
MDSAVKAPGQYYTVTQLCQVLQKQGVDVRCTSTCANDTYAIRIDGKPWAELKEALASDERLSIKQEDGHWTISPNAMTARGEGADLDRYLNAVKDSVHNICAAVWAKVEKERADGKTDDANPTTPVDMLAYLVQEHEVSFPSIAVTIALTGKDGVGFNRLQQSNLFDSRTYLFDDGDLTKFSTPLFNWAHETPSQIESLARSISLGAELLLEPVSAKIALRFAGYRVNNHKLDLTMTMQDVVNSGRVEMPVDYSGVFTSDEVNAVTARSKQSPPTAQQQPLNNPRTMRVSEALLRTAEASHSDLIYYVSPLTDPWVKPTRLSTPEVLSAANRHIVDNRMQERIARQRLGVDMRNTEPAKVTPIDYSIQTVHDILIVRNERRFMDGLCQSQSVVSTEIENMRLHDERPSIVDLAKTISAMPIEDWADGLYATNYLQYCNPVSFRPFASALATSPSFQTKLASLGPEAELDLHVSELETRPQMQLLGDIGDCSQVAVRENDEALDPIIGGALVSDRKTDGLELSIKREGEVVHFLLHYREEIVWSASVINVKLQ